MSIRHPVWPCIMLATDQINCVPYAPICIRRLIQSNNEPRAQRMRRFSFATYPSKKKLSLEWCPLLIHLFFFFWIVDFLCFLSFSVKSFLVDRNVLLEKLFFFFGSPHPISIRSIQYVPTGINSTSHPLAQCQYAIYICEDDSPS